MLNALSVTYISIYKDKSFFEYLNLINICYNLMMPAKMGSINLLKTNIFWSKDYDI